MQRMCAAKHLVPDDSRTLCFCGRPLRPIYDPSETKISPSVVTPVSPDADVTRIDTSPGDVTQTMIWDSDTTTGRTQPSDNTSGQTEVVIASSFDDDGTDGLPPVAEDTLDVLVTIRPGPTVQSDDPPMHRLSWPGRAMLEVPDSVYTEPGNQQAVIPLRVIGSDGIAYQANINIALESGPRQSLPKVPESKAPGRPPPGDGAPIKPSQSQSPHVSPPPRVSLPALITATVIVLLLGGLGGYAVAQRTSTPAGATRAENSSGPTSPTGLVTPPTSAGAARPTPTSTPTSIGAGHPTLKLGDSGIAVTELQQRLAAAGFFGAPADGDLGPETQSAIRRFQAAKRLTATGVADAATWAALPTPTR